MNLVCRVKGHEYKHLGYRVEIDMHTFWCERCMNTVEKTGLELEIESAKKRKPGKVEFVSEATAEEEGERDHPLRKLFGQVYRKPQDEEI